MSEDENATASGGNQPNTDANNSSLIGKMRSRVSNILPQTISKWFSPVSGGEGSSHNGNLRRRRDDMQHDDLDSNTDGSDSENDEDPAILMPPSKKSRLNVPEEYPHRNIYIGPSSSRSHDFLSSTPTSKRRKYLNLPTKESDSPYVFPNINRMQPSHISTEIDDKRYMRYTDEDVLDNDVLEVIPENDEPEWDNSRGISSRKFLNIPSDLNRRTLLDNRSTEHSQTNRSTSSQNTTLNEGEEKKSSEKVVLTNGRISNVIGDTESDSGESRCSSLQKNKISGNFGNTGSKSLRTSGNVGLNFYSHLEGKKSLFSDKNITNTLNNSTISLTSLNRRQSFNASLYGSTSALSDSRLLNISSPFYKGRTTYGGASAYSKNPHKYQQQVLNRVSRTPISIKPSSSLSSLSSSNNSLAQGTDVTTPISNTAKRILELMNQFTTPLTNAKKMANTIKVPSFVDHKRRFNDEDLIQSRAIRMSMPKTPYSRPTNTLSSVTTSKTLAPPITELQVPTMANLLQLKKLQNSVEKVREIANASKSNLNAREEYKLPKNVTQNLDSDNSSKHISKIKHKTSTRSSAKNTIIEQETLPPINLPEISLPLMKSVPKIDISIVKPSNNYQPQSTVTSVSKLTSHIDPEIKKQNTTVFPNLNEETTYSSKSILSPSRQELVAIEKQKPVKITHHSDFIFSNPVTFTNAINTNMNFPSVSTFKFSEPIKIDIKNQDSQSNSKSFENFKFVPLESTKQKDVERQSVIITETKSSTPQLKTGSVLDALKKQSNQISEGSSFGDQFKMSNNDWECSICMIRNNNTDSKCIACQTPKENLNIVKTDTAMKFDSSESKGENENSNKNPLSNIFKPKDNTWECPNCMIQNDNTLKECVACKAIKPGEKKLLPFSSIPSVSSSVPNTIKDNGFQNLVAQQSSKWECSGCMTYNEQTRSKCACCEQPKPGTSLNTDVAKPNFFGITTNSKFTFGFAKKNEEKVSTVTSSSSTNEKNKDENMKGFSFGTNAVTSSTLNILNINTQPVFGFKSNDKKNKNDKDVPDVSSSSFKLGAVKTFSFGFSKPNEVSDLKDLKAASEFTQSDQKTSTTTASTFKFGSPAIPAVSSVSAVNSEKKESIAPKIFGASSFIQKPDSTADSKNLFSFMNKNKSPKVESEKKSNFSFSGENSSSKSSLPTFASPVLTQKCTDEPVKNIPSFGSSQIIPSTTSINLFEKPSMTISSVSSIFGNNNVNFTNKTTSISGTTSSTPIFGTAITSTATSSNAFGTVTPLSQQNNIFGSSFSASNNSSGPLQSNSQPSNLFNFTSTTKSANNSSGSIFGSVSSTTNKPFTFGSNPTTTTTNSSTPFVFGSQSSNKKSESLFGSTASNNQNNNPTFPSVSTNNLQQQQSETKSLFGQSSNVVTPFSSNLNTTPAFGTSPTLSVFGSATPTFGGTGFGGASSNNNNPTFGSVAATTNPTFGSTGFGSSENNSLKKIETSSSVPAFNFSAGAQSTSSGGFSFGTVNNNPQQNHRPFSFQANAAPSFNFTGSHETTNTSPPPQPFQFGAVPLTPSFNFSGIETTSNAPFQFSAAGVNAAANIFNPTPTPGSSGAQQTAIRRKMRTRRNPPR